MTDMLIYCACGQLLNGLLDLMAKKVCPVCQSPIPGWDPNAVTDVRNYSFEYKPSLEPDNSVPIYSIGWSGPLKLAKAGTFENATEPQPTIVVESKRGT